VAIEAQIAQVISAYEVAFNAGSDAGVVPESTAVIFNDTEVNDPATGEPLGVVRRPALSFRIEEVHAKFSVGRTLGIARKNPATAFNFVQNPAERIRVTTIPAERDYRTRVIATGQYVEIEPPEPKEVDSSAAET